MTYKLITMEVISQIKLLSEQGVGKKTIAKQFGISKNTVKEYLLKSEEENKQILISQKLKDLEEFFPYCKEELKREGVTRFILWGEYKLKFTNGYQYSQFCDRFNQWMGKYHGTLHIEQLPGDRFYIDFSGSKLAIVDKTTGEITEVEVFVGVLGFSGLTYVEACLNQQKEHFYSCIVNALNYFGGVPKVLIPDNLKSAVDKANKYEPIINRDMLDLGNHYNLAIMSTRSLKPRDKAWVERMVGIVYNRVFAPLRNRIFTSLAELNEAIIELVEIHNNLPLQGRTESRRILFDAEEKQCLQPLPQEGYELKEYQKARLMKNNYVQLHKDRHYYSAPYQYIGQMTMLIYTKSHVAIYLKDKRIAYHIRDYKKYGYTEVKEHLSSEHQFVSDWHPEKFITWAAQINPIVHQYILKILESKAYPEQTYRSCVGILAYDKKAGRDRLIAACKRASEFGAYSYTVIKNIIDKKLDRQSPEETTGSLPINDTTQDPSIINN